MTSTIMLPAPGTLGSNKGGASTGVIVGALAATELSKGLLKSLAQPCLCATQDAGLITDETTAANEATTDDVEILGTTIADDDAIYIGHGSVKFSGVDINVSTEGNYTTTTFVAEYWDGDSWELLDDPVNYATVLDGEGTGVISCTHTVPSDWEINTIITNAGTLEGYFIRIRVDGASGGTTTPAQLAQIWVVMDADDAVFSDDTTDINDAGAADVALLAASNIKVGDGFYFGHATEKFCKLLVTTSTALSATLTITWKYWDGNSWEAIPEPFTDDSSGFTASAGALLIHFEPPSDWTANTTANGPDGNAGYFIVAEVTAFTSLTTAPVATSARVYPLKTGATGITVAVAGTVGSIEAYAATISASNADSRFLLINTTTGAFDEFTWTAATATDNITGVDVDISVGDKVAIAQIQEDGTTEYADAAFNLVVS